MADNEEELVDYDEEEVRRGCGDICPYVRRYRKDEPLACLLTRLIQVHLTKRTKRHTNK
jgi:hypothetical protein